MADISITAANVVAGGNAKTVEGTAGATITAGQVLYLDSDAGTYKLADCDSATAAARSPAGIALNGAASGQPVRVLKSGNVTIGGTLTAAVGYYLSPTAGGICPIADLSSGDYPTLLGFARSTSVLAVDIQEATVALG